MELALSILVLLWCGGFIFVIMYLYKFNSKPYLSEFLEMFLDKIPSNLNPNELSILLYKKITPFSFTSTILILIKKNIIKVEPIKEDYKLVYQEGFSLSFSQKYLISLLFEVIGEANTVTIKEIASYTKTHSNATTFLMEYELWKKSAYKDTRYDYYENKVGYTFIRIYGYTGIVLMLLNFLLNSHLISIYFLVLPIFFMYFYFYNIYKRTYSANTEYFKWLAYKHSLLHAKMLPKEEKDTIYIYSTVLDCLDSTMAIYDEKGLFASKLDKAINKCIHNAILGGDRRIKFP